MTMLTDRIREASRTKAGLAGIFAALSIAAAVLVPLIYRSWGIAIIEDAYNGRSFGLLNRMAQVRSYHPLEKYYEWANALIAESVVVLVGLAVLLGAFALNERLLASGRVAGTRYLHRFDRAVFWIGLLLSPAIVLALPAAYHQLDVQTFAEWQRYLRESWRDIYLACDSCNYPMLGTLFSAGVMEFSAAVMPGIDAENQVLFLRVFLALFDCANVVLIYLILRVMNVPRSLFWAGLLGLLPSSWAGSAVWGQIDGITQTLLLAYLLLTLRYLATLETRPGGIAQPGAASGYTVLSALIIGALLLTKQLALFSVPILASIVLATILLTTQRHRLALMAALAAAASAMLFLPDLFLNLRDGYFSHLQYILLGGGSDHGNVIAGNGFNMWVLLGRDESSASTVPFLGFLTPRGTGVLLFLIYELFLLAGALLWLKNEWPANSSASRYRHFFLLSVFVLALTNLAFNVFISGTHERYLHHFYPYIVIVYLGMRETSDAWPRIALPAILAGALLYGRFVWGILSPDFIVFPSEALAIFHILLLALLSWIFVRECRARSPGTPRHAGSPLQRASTAS